jgi:hypothetical protein
MEVLITITIVFIPIVFGLMFFLGIKYINTIQPGEPTEFKTAKTEDELC